MGSGFYIGKNFVITNAHVVKGSSFVEIETSVGKKSFGKVIKQNSDYDLALIEVAVSGIAVEFYNEAISQGAEVIAIGHPRGLKFSMTRGVVSSVRKKVLNSITNDTRVEIQTDTPINPGNSGGPLYIGEYVVGINTQKNIQAHDEGLGFAVHYETIKKFLD